MLAAIKPYAPRKLLALSAAFMLLLSGCASDQAHYAAQVKTVLPSDVAGCSLIGPVDTGARATIENARFDLQVKAGQLGASHLVETYAYARPINRLSRDMMGIALSGRAYLCPEGVGPTQSNPEAYQVLPYDLPHPEVNNDDPFYHLFY